jgi:hypothetical protein
MIAFQFIAVMTNVIVTVRNAGISLVNVINDQKVPFPLCIVTPHTMQYYRQIHDRHLQKLTEALEGNNIE